MFFKEYKKEFVIYILLCFGCIILFFCLENINSIVSFVNKISSTNLYNIEFIKILLKITGISIILEYTITICKDSGENALASKIDLGGKVILISMSIPIITSTIEVLTSLIS